jgi:tetratricopeptide (TPR) repeat protein
MRLGRFELLRLLGSGGMGEVWLARQDGLERHVAVKILPSASHQQSIDRLRREAQALARIRHPHVVPVHEVGEAGGLHYYVMDLVDGRSLEEVLAAGRLSCARAAEIARQIAEALAAAHDQGVVHRDVKPANVLLADGPDHVTLVDFGIAMSELAPTLTRTGDLLGTLHYMAPEQARGEAYLADARTDVWGVGVTLYEMVTGTRPFDGEPAIVVRSAVLEREPVAPRRHRADCPRDLETIVLRCLDKDPERRYPTARALADDLAHLLADEPVRARRASLGYRIGKHVRRHRGAWLVGAVTAALGVLGLMTSVIAGRAAERDRAAGEADELVRVARGFAERGDTGEAWTRLREVELRFPHTPAVIGAYWAMAALAERAQGEDDGLAQEVWLDRLLEADPPAGDAARARWRLGRIYDKYGFLDDAHDLYARAADSGALSPSELEDARFGLTWTEWLGRRTDAEIGGRVIGAGDLDGDGRDEVFVFEPPHGLVALALRAGRLEVVQRWVIPELDGQPRMWVRPPEFSVVDVNGDGRPDLLSLSQCFVADLGGWTPRRVLDFHGCDLIKTGDLDGDHQPDLVMAKDGLQLVHVARDWSTREIVLDNLALDETRVTGLDIADLDGDGRAELIYAGGMWTRYDVRVASVDHDALRTIARVQVGAIFGLAAIDLDGDGRREIFAVKSHSAPNPRLFDDDPFLGPSGPMVLRLTGSHLERTWFDPLVPATGPPTDMGVVTANGRTRLGPAIVVSSPRGVLHLYFGRPGRDPIRRDLRRLGAANLTEGGLVFADLDGDGYGEPVLGGARVTAYGVGLAAMAQRRELRRTGADWLSTARQLRDAGEIELALNAYHAAAAEGADPVAVAFEEGGCHAKAQSWELALARFRDARTGGRRDAELWRAILEAAESSADWRTALDAARALGDTARAGEIEKLTAIRTVFLQDFVEPWTAWRVEQPLACRPPNSALGLSLLPGDRALALPIEWDGSSFEVSAVVALRDVQYAKSFEIDLARDEGLWAGAGGIGGIGGGGLLQVHTYLRSPPDRRAPAELVAPLGVDWSVFPERVRMTLSYVADLAQWQIALHDLGGKRLHHAIVRSASRPAAGRYVMRLTRPDDAYLSASVVELYRFEIRAAPGALRVVPAAASDPPQRCASDLAPAGASSPLHRAFALASAGRIDDAAHELAAWRPSAIARAYPRGFELDSYHLSEWEAGLVRLALLDEPLTSAIVEAGHLMPRRAWGELLRRLAYQQYVDSGQTHWREGVLTLRHATELAPDDPHGWYMLGYCHYRLGDLTAARTAFERAVALDPEIERRYPKQGGPAILLARIAARERDAAAAARWLDQATRHGGNLDIARHDRTLRELLGDRLPQILGN